jgi:hypothetical protein
VEGRIRAPDQHPAQRIDHALTAVFPQFIPQSQPHSEQLRQVLPRLRIRLIAGHVQDILRDVTSALVEVVTGSHGRYLEGMACAA